VADEDLKIGKVKQAKTEHWLDGFKDYKPDADKDKPQFLELNRRLTAENDEKFAQYEKNRALKEEAFMETWSEKQLDSLLEAEKKVNENLRSEAEHISKNNP